MRRPSAAALGLFVLLALAFTAAPGSAAVFRGMVADEGSSEPIEGATIEVDREPTDGAVEALDESNVVGAFRLDGLAPGSYVVAVRHPAYQDGAATIEIADDGDRVARNFRLERLPDRPEVFDIDVHVQGVRTGINIAGATVTVERFAPDDPDGEAVYQHDYETGADGRIVARGMTPGYFEFTVSHPHWETVNWPGSAVVASHLVDRAHSARAALKPKGAQLIVAVDGFDPTEGDEGAYGPLEDVTVEITGLHPDTDEVLVAPRSKATNMHGRAVFEDLGPIRWQVEAKKHGYALASTVATPGADGSFSMVEHTLGIHEDTGVEIELTSDFDPESGLLDRAHWRLEGIAGTGAEGIVRTDDDSEGGRIARDRLLPGKYRLHVGVRTMLRPGGGYFPAGSGAMEQPGQRSLWVTLGAKDTVLEVADNERRTFTLRLEPSPARIRGRVFVVNENFEGNSFEEFGPNTSATWLPSLQPVQGIEFAMHDGTAPFYRPETFAAAHADDEAFYVRVDADAEGHFQLEVPPGLYGIRIPEMEGYAGRFIVLRSFESREGNYFAEVFPSKAGWPYPSEWPHAEWDMMYHRPWLELNSDVDFEMDLYVVQHALQGLGGVEMPESDEPFVSALVSDLGTAGAFQVIRPDLFSNPDTCRLEGMTAEGEPLELASPIHPSNRTYRPYFLFGEIPPGDYMVSCSLPGWKSREDSSAEYPLVIPDNWDPYPGAPPLYYESYSYAADPPLPGPRITWGVGPDEGWPFAPVPDVPYQEVGIDYRVWDSGDIYMPGGGYRQLFVRFPDQPLLIAANRAHSGFAQPLGEGYELWGRVTDWEQDKVYWARLSGVGDDGYTVYRGGERNNVSEALPPGVSGSYRLELHAVTAEGEDLEGIKITLSGGEVVVSGTTTDVSSLFDYELEIHPDSSEWAERNVRSEVVVGDDGVLVRGYVTVSRQMAIRGVVQNDAGEPVVGAAVNIYDRSGRELTQVTTEDGENGSVAGRFQTGLPSQTILVGYERRGYYPVRERYAPSLPTELDIEGITIAQRALPAPTVSAFDIDRYGLFLPGALKSADASGTNVDNAIGALTARWRVTAAAAAVQTTMDDFDRGGVPGAADRAVSFDDEITEVLLVDPRSFPPGETHDPDAAESVTVPEGMDYDAAVALIVNVTRRPEEPVDPTRTDSVTVPAVVTAEGRLQDGGEWGGDLELWRLPAGPFTPKVVVVTRRGAVGTFDYQVPADKDRLYGVDLPPWAAFLADIVGTVANASPELDLSDMMPRGYLMPLPSFDVSIAQTTDNYLRYEYALDVALNEGTKAPSSGLLSLGPRNLGPSLSGRLAFRVDGKENTAALAGALSLSQDFAQSQGLHLPAVFGRRAGGGLPSVGGLSLRRLEPHGTGEIAFESNIDPRAPGFQMRTTIRDAGVAVGVDYDLTPIASKIPYVGPFVLGAAELGVAQFFATGDLDLAGTVSTVWHGQSEPEEPEPGTEVPVEPEDPRAPDRHFLGTVMERPEFKLTVLVGAGLRASVLRGSVEARGRIQIGPPAGMPGTTGLDFHLNDPGVWPPFERVRGAVSFRARVDVTVLGATMGRSVQYDMLQIDWQPNTEPFMEVVPSNAKQVVITPFTAPAPVWTNSDGLLVEDLYAAGDVALSGPDGAALAYTHTDPDDGSMTIVVAVSDGEGGWKQPRAVAATGGVESLTVVELKDDSLLVVWSEFDAEDLGDPNGTTRVAWSLGDAAGESWTVPEVVLSSEGVIQRITAVRAGDRALVVFLEALDGALAGARGIGSLTWAGGEFGAASEVAAPAVVVDVALAADPDEPAGTASLAVLGEGGAVAVHLWDGGTWTLEEEALVESGGAAVDLAYGEGGARWLAVATRAGAVELFASASPWEPLGAIASERGSLAEVAVVGLDGPDGPRAAVAWIEAGPPDTLVYLYLDADGAVLGEPITVDLPAGQELGGLVLAPVPGGDYEVAVLIETADAETPYERSLREVVLDPHSEPSAPPSGPGGVAGLDSVSSPKTDGGNGTGSGDANEAGGGDDDDSGGGGGGCGPLSEVPTGGPAPLLTFLVALVLLWRARVRRVLS